VSLDTLDSKKYLKITRGGNLEKVLEGLSIAKKIGLKVKINTVALKNININELGKMVDWCINKKFNITFIEVMPMDMENTTRLKQYYPLTKVRSFLEKRYTLENTNINTGGPAKYVKIKNSNQKIGFINPLTNNFCESCNRVRLTCTGRIYSCLGHNKFVDLKVALLKSKKYLKDLILKSIYLKPKSHEFEIDKESTNKNLERTMNVTGG
jgi:cyclic pyranopterin phosphate synthase